MQPLNALNVRKPLEQAKLSSFDDYPMYCIYYPCSLNWPGLVRVQFGFGVWTMFCLTKKKKGSVVHRKVFTRAAYKAPN